MFVEQIGYELKSLRARRNINLEEASKLTGYHKNTLNLYETNPANLKLSVLLDLLKKYNEDGDIFFDNICEYIHKNKERR